MSAQHLQALAKANEKRLARSAIRKRIASGELSVVDVLHDLPAALCPAKQWAAYRENNVYRWTITELLAWQHGWGERSALRFLHSVDVSSTLPLEALSPPTIDRIAEALA